MNCPVCKSLQPNDVTRCGSCGTPKDGNCVLEMPRQQRLALANMQREVEMDEVMENHKAGRVPDLIEATNEVFARYHAAIANL